MNAPEAFRAGSIWSLLDLLKLHAPSILKLGFASGWTGRALSLPDAALAGPIPKKTVDATLLYLASMRDDIANPIGAKVAVVEIDRLIALVESGRCTGKTLRDKNKSIYSRIEDELKGTHFLYVEPGDAPYFDGGGNLFGPEVAAKFNLSEDIEAAGKCLALGQSTACVFHLMRVMETGVHRLGKLLKVKFDPTKQSWYEICNSAAKKAVNRPAKTPRQRAMNAALGAAAAHLQTVRLAWRNQVMHPKQTYTQDQAREVFNATRTFMMDLARLV